MQRVFVAGHRGMVGRAIVRQLAQHQDVEVIVRDRHELDLCNQVKVRQFFEHESIDQVYLAAARVGGIFANSTYPAEFIYQNLMIQSNVIHSAHECHVQRLLFLGSSCIYPKYAPQPMTETDLLTGKLEPTNEPYAIAKIAGIKMCQAYNKQYQRDYRCVMPTNLYGPYDNFHPEHSHVIPALMYKFGEAIRRGDESVEVWGTGRPKREFMHVDDLANAAVFVMNLDADQYCSVFTEEMACINVGTGHDIEICQLAELIKTVSGFEGKIIFDTTKPDGTVRKLMNNRLLSALGWQSSIDLQEGLGQTWRWYLQNRDRLRMN